MADAQRVNDIATALQIAVRNGNLELAQRLTDRYAPVRRRFMRRADAIRKLARGMGIPRCG